MFRTVSLLLFTLLWMQPASAQLVAADRDVQACALFTAASVSLEADVTPEKVSLTIASQSPLSLTFPPGSALSVRIHSCTMVIDSAQDEVAIGIPMVDQMGTSTTSLLIARFDLKKMAWSKPLQLDPPAPMESYLNGRYLNAFRLVGYREESSDLVVVSSDDRAILSEKNGKSVEVSTNLSTDLFATLTSINTAHNRFWGSCNQHQKIFGKAEPCSLVATSLLGPPKIGPTVVSPVVTPQKGVLQWSQPEFYADTGRSLIIAGYPASGIHPAHYLWITTLNDGLIHQMTVHSSFRDDSLSGVAALSPDGDILAFSVSMSKLACCLVDNYISQGDRIVIVSISDHKQIAEIRPPNRENPLAFTVDHEGKKTVLLVNWGDGWQRKEFLSH